MSLDYFGRLVGDICSIFLATEHFLISKIKNEVDHHESTTSHVSLQVAKGEEVFESFVKFPSDVQV